MTLILEVFEVHGRWEATISEIPPFARPEDRRILWDSSTFGSSLPVLMREASEALQRIESERRQVAKANREAAAEKRRTHKRVGRGRNARWVPA